MIVICINVITPYIWYEKLSSACIKYVFVIEEYGYLSKKEANMLINELEDAGFEKKNIDLEYTNKKVNYGDEIYLKINYKYIKDLPLNKTLNVPMSIEKYSICKTM